MRHYFFVLLYLAALPNAIAAQVGEQPANPGKVRRVTLYRDQALVTRVLSIPANKQEQEIFVGILPEQVDINSVYAEGNESIEVRSVRVTQQATTSSDRTEVRELVSKLDDLHIASELNQFRQRVILKKLAYIDQLMDFSAQTAHADLNKGVLNTTSLTDLVNYSMDKQVEFNEEAQSLDSDLSGLAKQKSVVQEQLDLLSQPHGNRHEVRLLVSNRLGKAGTLELSYLVAGCGWSPQYTIRGFVDKDTFDFRHSALIEQMSGEDWSGIQLTLSTASPGIGATGPSLTPFRVSVGANDTTGYDAAFEETRPVVSSASAIQQLSQSLHRQKEAVDGQFAAKHSATDNRTRDYALNAVANALQNIELQADARQLKTLASDVGEAVSSQTYQVEQAVSLDSRREQQLVQIIDAELTGELYHTATPLLSSFAYREADIVNDRNVGFLGGPATIYLDGRFVGRTEIPSIASGQHLIVGFGADQQVRTRRELLEKSDEILGGNRRLTLKYRLVIANFKSRPVALRLFDRLPLADQSAEISVRPLGFQFPISEDGLFERMQKPRGVLRWDLAILGERFGKNAFDVDYSYSVEFDRSQVITSVASLNQIETDYLEIGATSNSGGMSGGGMGGGMGSSTSK